MSGYTPVFNSIFTGTLHGKWPDTGIWVCLLALADWRGHVDMTPEYIAAVTGVPLADLEACIERFTQPDSRSRSQADDGRRLVLIEPTRPWGWRIVNIQKYRERARDSQRVADGRNAQKLRRWRESKRHPTTPDETRANPCDPNSDSDSDSDSDTNSEKSRRGASAPAAATRKRLASRIPDGWEPSVGGIEYAERELPNVDVPRLAEAFSDYWRAAAGEKARKVDWDATWRTWVRRATGEYPMKAPTPGAPGRAQKFDMHGNPIHA